MASLEIGRCTWLGSTLGPLLGIALVAIGVRGAILLFAFAALTRSTRKRGAADVDKE